MALVVLVERADRLVHLADAVRQVAPSGVEAFTCPEDPGIPDGLLRRNIGRLVAVIVGPGVQRLTSVAHGVRRADSIVQIVFLASEADLSSLSARLGLIPRLGPYWSAVSASPDSIASALRSAIRATPQRRQFRTTLERVNTQVADLSESPAEAYRRLMPSDRFLASVLAYAPVPVASVDRHGTVLTWNHEAERLFCRTERDAVGHTVGALLGAAAGSSIAAALERLAVTHKQETVGIAYAGADGRTLDLSVTLASVPNQSGRLTGVALVFEIEPRVRPRSDPSLG